MNASSLFVYVSPVTSPILPAEKKRALRDAGSGRETFSPLRILVVLFFYNGQNLFIFLLVSICAIAPYAPHTIVSLVVLLTVMYAKTFLGEPTRTGSRSNPYFRQHWLFNEMAKYFDLQIVSLASQPLDPTHRHIMGYHPHGIVPFTAGWMSNTTTWAKVCVAHPFLCGVGYDGLGR
jgi:hypothetical protein